MKHFLKLLSKLFNLKLFTLEDATALCKIEHAINFSSKGKFLFVFVIIIKGKKYPISFIKKEFLKKRG